MLWVLISTVHLTVRSYHVTYTFQNESTLYSCSNVKELLAQNKHDIWSLSDCNAIRTHYHLVRKQTFNHLAKLAKWLSCVVSTYQLNHLAPLAKSLSVHLQTKWLWVRVLLQPLKLQILCLFQARSSLTFRQLQSVDSLWNAYVT